MHIIAMTTSTVAQAAPPPLASPILPATTLLIDEITALMVSRSTNKMTLANLTKKYNESFRSSSGQPVSAIQLAETLKQLSNFKVNQFLCVQYSGLGATSFLQA